MENKKKIQIGVRVEDEVYQSFRDKVLGEGRKLCFVVQELMRQYAESE